MRAIMAALSIGVVAGVVSAGEVTFKAAPTASSADGGATISFTVSEPTDVEVTILDATGRAVRHLAAGVLGGVKPPPAPLKPSLAQELGWDGKDDAGRKAEGGPFKVRVRAGMSVAFGRMIGGSPYTGQVTTGAPSDSLAVAPDGTLYVKMGSFVPQLHAAVPWQIRTFDRNGAYRRTVLPWAPSTPADKTPGFRLIDAGDGLLTPANHTPLDPVVFNVGSNIYRRIVDGSLVFIDGGAAKLRFIKMDGSNALTTVPMRSSPKVLQWAKWLAPQVALSPDGTYAYYSNVARTPYDGKKPSDIDPKFPQGRVYRHDLATAGADPKPFFDLDLPDWEKTKYWMPSAWDKKTAAAGIDVDPTGHVFVCDLVNQEVVEVSPDGKEVSATKVPWPDKVIVGKGALYVVSRKVSRGYPPPATLYKVVGRGAEARVKATLSFKGRSAGQTVALDDSGDVPVLWLGGRSVLMRVEDRGDEFIVTAENILNRDRDAIEYVCYADVDAENDLVYVTQGMGPVWRFDGRTGKGGRLKIRACDLALGPGGMVYTWGTTGSYSGAIARYGRNLKPAPIGGTGKHTYGALAGRYGRGNSVCGLDVDARGRVFAVTGGNNCHVRVYDAEGSLVSFERQAGEKSGTVPAAVTGISGRGGSIRVDAAGNIYILQEGLPKGFTPPKGFEKDVAYLRSTGTIYKFGPDGGEFKGKGWTGRRPVGALAAYPGCGAFSGAWNSTMSVCVCQKPRFDVYACGRLYIPNTTTFKVRVVDNAGNEILTFGGYGNFDSRGPESKEPKPPIPLGWPTAVGASDDHIYVGDMLNHRVVRADKRFALEETVETK